MEFNTKIDSELEHRCFDGREIRSTVSSRSHAKTAKKSTKKRQSCVTFCVTDPFCFAVLVAIILVVTLAS